MRAESTDESPVEQEAGIGEGRLVTGRLVTSVHRLDKGRLIG